MGVIVRSGEALEKLSKIRSAALDKTGTLTTGKPGVSAVLPLDGSCSESELLRLAALAEQKSEHPLGKAICRVYEAQGGKAGEAEDFKVLAGQGVSALVDGRQILVGKEDFMRSRGIDADIAIESADAVLVSDEIKRLPYLFMLAQKVMKKIRTNIIASLLINLSAVLLSAFGILNPVTGALRHNFGSVFVVVNAALLRLKDEHP